MNDTHDASLSEDIIRKFTPEFEIRVFAYRVLHLE